MQVKTARPVMKSIRAVAESGLLPEHALRRGVREGWVPGVYVGNRFLVNEGKLIEYLNGGPAEHEKQDDG